jgi:hypothetical protein
MLVTTSAAASPIVSAIAKAIVSGGRAHPGPEEGTACGYAPARACESDLT